MDDIRLQPQRLRDLVLGEGGHAFDARTGRSYDVNGTGQAALRMLQAGYERDAVVEALARRCGAHPAVVEAGVAAFVSQLERIAQ